jgi:type I restriction enzyme M protein
LLGKHGTPEADSDFSWTLDFTARRANAQAKMLPFLEEVKNLTESLLPLKEDLKALKKIRPARRKIGYRGGDQSQ